MILMQLFLNYCLSGYWVFKSRSIIQFIFLNVLSCNMSGYDSDKVNKQSLFLWYFILFLFRVTNIVQPCKYSMKNPLYH